VVATKCQRYVRGPDSYQRDSPMPKHNVKLNHGLVRQIRALHRSGFFKVSIARLFHVSPSLVGRVLSGKCWEQVADLPDQLPVAALATDSPLRLTKINSSLTPQQVNEVRQLAQANYTQRSIAGRYGLPQSTVAELLSGSIYNRIPVFAVAMPDTRGLDVRYRTRRAKRDKKSDNPLYPHQNLQPLASRPQASHLFSMSGF